MRVRVFSVGAAALLLAATGVSQAAHVYAMSSDVNDSGLKVYAVRFDGSLVYRGKTAGPSNTQLVATPGGRYVYQFDGRWITQYDVQLDGTLRQYGAPVTYSTPDTYPGYPGIFGLAMHPSGDYLYAAADWTTIRVFRTDDIDGHLTELGPAACNNCNMIAMDPDGDFLFAGGNSDQPDPGPMRMISVYRIDRTNGALADTGKRFYLPLLQRIDADSRYVYAWNSQTGYDNWFHALDLAPDGTLRETVTAVPSEPFFSFVSTGRYFAASATGKNSDVKTYAIVSGSITQIDVRLTEVMYTMIKGSGRWSNTLFVVTDDGIVTYQVTNGGRLARIGKVMIPYANPVFYVNR